MSNFELIVFGVIFVALGLILSGTTPSPGVQVRSLAVTVADSTKQLVDNNLAAVKGERAQAQRDWLGWIIAGLGAVLLLIGLLR